MLLAQISDAIPIIDHAADKSDRWLFIAALVIMIVGGSCVIRWLTTSLAAKDAVHAAERKELIAEIKAERSECRASREKDQAAFLSAIEKKDGIVAAHTRAIESLTAMLTRRSNDSPR